MTQPDASAVLVLTTVPGDFDADALARTLVERRLAACVSALPLMRSTYRWKEAVELAEERQLVIKTQRGRVVALEAAIRELHPYDVPELLVLSVSGGAVAYLAWIAESLQGPERP